MKNHLLHGLSRAIVIGSVVVFTGSTIYGQAAAAAAAITPDLKSFQDKLAEVKTDLLKLEGLVTTPPAPPPDLRALGADLASLAATLHMLSGDIANAPNRSLAVAAFKNESRLTTVLGGINLGAGISPDVNTMLVGYNFKQPLAQLALIQDDLKSQSDFPSSSSTLAKHIDALSWSLQRLGTSLPSVGDKKITGLASGGTNDSWGKIFFWTGARLENPYAISVSNKVGTLKSGNSKADGFISLEANLRYIFRNGKYEDEYWLGKAEDHKLGDVNFYKPFWDLVPDIDFNVDYVFTGTSSPSNYSASTIAQGADISLYTSVGAPVMRYKPTGYLETNSMKMQITLPEIGGGMTTDKSFLVAHPNLFLGGGFQLAAPAQGFYWMGRLGYAMVDEPRIISGSTVATDGLGNPEFQWKGALTLGTAFIYKVTDSMSIKLGGDVYSTHVGTWDITAALSIDPTKFFKALQ